ncbi:AraC family transcriptional regulator [Actinoplanes sp. N902-109]|uniref:AraC family transcriptional regulator n=1 Tax=Actinoplanes sp. (strain N902-109) TaxID=649831 RepID=UPI0003294B79|nr:AraC family transcriptional regulator [Actinoplanes sp. N902-109]AGL14229.1 AraC family transcription regulator [Actinoplanes sp. N902-109]
MLPDLTDAIERHSTGFGSHTAVPRQTLVALDEPIVPADLVYEPMICFIAGGAKRSFAGERTWLVETGDMFVNTVAMPVTAVFERLPYRSVVLHLGGPHLTALLQEVDEPVLADTQMTAPMTPGIIDALTRWVGLLDTPRDIKVLAGRIEEEILYRLLTGPLGPLVRQWSRADTAAARIRSAAAWIVANYATPLSIDALATLAHMSPATLHRHFKASTGMSPLQFQKQLRLQEARRLLLNGTATAAQAAVAVGYTSATQFNREYRRFYGLPPARDTARLLSI